MGRAHGVHRPVLRLPVRYERSDADDRVVDMLWKLVAHRLADFYVGLADKIVGGCEPGEVGYGLQVPDDDAWFHAPRHLAASLAADRTHRLFGLNEQIFGVNEQVPGMGQTYLSDIGLKVMWKKLAQNVFKRELVFCSPRLEKSCVPRSQRCSY